MTFGILTTVEELHNITLFITLNKCLFRQQIPSSAVEMPGGAESGAGMFLDVQFGALEPDHLVADTAHTPKPVNINFHVNMICNHTIVVVITLQQCLEH